ncbi:MAG: argininosuccinate lyase [Methanomicrobiaceae archaeon]|nr:argininosuccinate lyase [Methanomicrobiaceae archaeon]
MPGDHLRKGRLGDVRPPEVAEFLSSMETDRWIADADIFVDIAHLLMLSDRGIIDRDAARAIMAVLLELLEKGIPREVFDARYEDIHAGIEAHLIARAGADYGGRIHMGRSRNDEVATCIRMRLREELLGQMDALVRLRALLIALADRHRDSIMPGFTHFQHAQPTTLAHYFLAYEQAFGRDFDRIRDCFARVDRCPLGAAAFASTGYPVDREQTASYLGFAAIAENTMDAVSARDFALEAMSASTLAMATVSRICEELVLWSSSFVDFVRLADPYCSTSSIMPQKKNPDTAEIMRAKAGTVSGSLMSALTIMKGLPMSYNRDMQELTPHLRRSTEATQTALLLLAGMLETAAFNTERMAEEAGRGFSTATEVADVLVRDFGLPFRTAHGIVGRAVRTGTLDLASLEEAAGEMAGISLIDRGLTEEGVAAALDPGYGATVRKAPGGPAPVPTAAAIVARREQCSNDEAWITMVRERIDTAQAAMIEEARRLVASPEH